MEVVAAIASVTQLTGYAIRLIAGISETQERIKGRPARIVKRLAQLQ